MAIPALIWSLYQQGAQAVTQRRPFKSIVVRRFISVVVFCALIGGALYLKEHVHWRKPSSSAAKASPGAVGAERAAPHNVTEPTFKWPVAVVLGGILLVAGIPLTRIYLGERRHHQQRAAMQTLEHREQLAASIEVIVDDLLDEPDPRRAIIAAYARMETLFAHAGVTRQENETAREYLRSLMIRMTGQAEALERLTMLFERAKFGRADVTFPMKRSAIATLRQIRADLLKPSRLRPR